jgi:hypothetical protein
VAVAGLGVALGVEEHVEGQVAEQDEAQDEAQDEQRGERVAVEVQEPEKLPLCSLVVDLHVKRVLDPG